ncbi:MAG: SUMF1/EgtB/PvdO family nonheme iron enzyme [Nannocystaceae bacterium]
MRRALIRGAGGLLAAILGAWGLGRCADRDADAARDACLAALAAEGERPDAVWVPGGALSFGDVVLPEEGPIVAVEIEGFWIDRREVTNDQFAAFVRSTGYVTEAERPIAADAHPELPAGMRRPGGLVFSPSDPADSPADPAAWWRYVVGADWRHPGGPGTSIEGKGAFPVVQVTYGDALAYAQWRGRALPSEAEWEWAARGGAPRPASTVQPAAANTWQGLFPTANHEEDGFEGLAPAGCYPANGYAIHDMIGNVWEWTASLYSPRHGLEPRPHEARRVIKGGSYLCAPNYCTRYRAGARQPQEADLAASHVGFRTILRGGG